MKQLIYTALVSLIAGICFTLGVMGVVLVAESWKSEKNASKNGEWVNSPSGVTISEHERVEGTPSFTVQGLVQNESERIWFEVGVEAKIFAGRSQMNECDTTIRGRFAPGERRAFQIECYGVAGAGIPENINYEVAVVYGRAES